MLSVKYNNKIYSKDCTCTWKIYKSRSISTLKSYMKIVDFQFSIQCCWWTPPKKLNIILFRINYQYFGCINQVTQLNLNKYWHINKYLNTQRRTYLHAFSARRYSGTVTLIRPVLIWPPGCDKSVVSTSNCEIPLVSNWHTFNRYANLQSSVSLELTTGQATINQFNSYWLKNYVPLFL